MKLNKMLKKKKIKQINKIIKKCKLMEIKRKTFKRYKLLEILLEVNKM